MSAEVKEYEPGELTVREKWTQFATKKLLGRKVVEVRYLTQEEQEEMGWLSNPLAIFFDDGSYIFAMADDEGNDGGALAGGKGEKDYTFPVLWTGM